jgi:hypothetical protein
LNAITRGHGAHGEHHDAPDSSQAESQDTWLGELQAMLRALVEFTLTGLTLATVARVAPRHAAAVLDCAQRAISPQPRPPRMSLA